ncbi:MAG: ribosome small subunit-dependent GTPase A, partial [Balneolaceae bacterium]|nr:ribosome small subunit-dependent GTPase A [Balneolaceae bacterium]
MSEAITGRVIQSTGSWYEVAQDPPGGEDPVIRCRLPGRFRQRDLDTTNPISVGDRVSVTMNQDGTGSIEEIHDRENFVIRQATRSSHEEQILVSNIDRAYVVQSVLKPRLKQGFIDRFLVTCEAYGVPAALVINKMDLAGGKERERISGLQDLYEELGYPVHLTTIKDSSSLEGLKAGLKGKTSVFIGPSGTGKSSIMNVLDPSVERKVGEVSDYNEKGKHTTTFARLVPLGIGGWLVDTPGIREFGLVNIAPWELSHYFPEMAEVHQQCKFNNCTHSHEPGCAVMEAYEDGHIHPDRYHSYLQILDS